VRHHRTIASITRRFVANPTNQFFPAQQLSTRASIKKNKPNKNSYFCCLKNTGKLLHGYLQVLKFKEIIKIDFAGIIYFVAKYDSIKSFFRH